MERNRDLFTATVTSQHTGILNSVTKPLLESAAAAATIPFDINLWHRRLGHHSYAASGKRGLVLEKPRLLWVSLETVKISKIQRLPG